MKYLVALVVVYALLVGTALGQKKNTPTTEKEKISYSLGANLGNSFRMQEIDIDVDMLIRGIKDARAGKKTAMTEKEIEATMTSLQKKMMGKADAKRKVDGDKNKKDGEAFLAANKMKEGVVTLPDGLQYKVIKMGDGPKPTKEDTVKVQYRGTFTDGNEFDNSYKYGEPAKFRVDRVIRGWTEALQLMPVGSKWQLFVPPDLAYGDRGAGQVIGPNATLIFEIELLSIK